MAGLVLEIEMDVRKAGKLHGDEMRVGRTLKVGLDLPDGLAAPVAAIQMRLLSDRL
jgi:hypothetical protein